MLDGRVLQVGRPRDMYSHPANRDVADFLGEANFLLGEVLDGHVQCQLGRIPVPPGIQGQVEVMIRPENLILSAEAGEPVEVTAVDYYGHDQLVTVKLSSGLPLKVRLLAGEELGPGQRLGLRLAGEVVVFPRP